VVAMTESGRQVAEAVERITTIMAREGAGRMYDPRELIRLASHGKNIGAYQAAMQSLLASGRLEQTENWTVRLRQQTS
jgi:hypothetical protein